jgi:hypothetical protein
VQAIPEHAYYRKVIEGVTKYRLQVVRDAPSVRGR